MAANHFVVNGADDVMDGEAIFFGGDLGVKEDLKEEVAEFIGELGIVTGVEGIEDFVRFFDEVGAEGGVGLLAVPGAAGGRAEAGHESDEFFEGWAGGCRAFAFWRFGFFGCAFAGRHEEKKDYHRGSRDTAEGTAKRDF
jgi:hypothetical protein